MRRVAILLTKGVEARSSQSVWVWGLVDERVMYVRQPLSLTYGIDEGRKGGKGKEKKRRTRPVGGDSS